MTNQTDDKAAQARQALGDIGPRLAALCSMGVADLREEFLRVYGFPTASRNREHLCKRIAWKIQADAEGGLSQRALDRIEQLAPLAPIRWRPNLKDIRLPEPAGGRPAHRQRRRRGSPASGASTPALPTRDDRLPPPGTIITREYRGKEYQVRVLAEGFEFDGGYYETLSKIAREIAGTNWNGFTFFKDALDRGQQGKA